MQKNNIWCIILAGGSGVRFWPLSTLSVPKQFLHIEDAPENFLQITARRFAGFVPPDRMVVVTNVRYEGLVRESLPQIPADNVLAEPYQRDTAAAIAFATMYILSRDPSAVVLSLPTDHVIRDEDKFRTVAAAAVACALEVKSPVVIGIRPTRPDTNYGYIQAEGLPRTSVPSRVRTFTEKPDREIASVFVASGEFLWNSGIYACLASTLLEAFRKHMPEMMSNFQGWEDNICSASREAFVQQCYTEIQKQSLERGVFEKSDDVWVLPADFGWHDIGTFESLHICNGPGDADGNVYNANDCLLLDCGDNLVVNTQENKLVAVSGLEGYVLINTDKVLLVCPRDDSRVRELQSRVTGPEFEKYR